MRAATSRLRLAASAPANEAPRRATVETANSASPPTCSSSYMAHCANHC